MSQKLSRKLLGRSRRNFQCVIRAKSKGHFVKSIFEFFDFYNDKILKKKDLPNNNLRNYLADRPENFRTYFRSNSKTIWFQSIFGFLTFIMI